MTASWVGILSIRLNGYILLGWLSASDAVTAATQQECTGEQDGSKKGTDGRKPRAFHGSTGLLA